MELLKVTSIQSPNADFFCRLLTRYISEHLEMPARFVDDIPWPERERLLDAGEIHVGWICGLPYVWKADQAQPVIELLAAPVMRHPRYQNRPIYFSDVVVHRESEFKAFADLRGASWAYNEPHSQSGYNITRFHLAGLDPPGPMGPTRHYFGRVVQAGSHLKALQLVLERRVDAAAIDSTVLELELESRPEIGAQLRVVQVLGPSPIPPWVVSKWVPLGIREALRSTLLHMHADPAGQTILARGQTQRFVQVEDRDYDPIRHMARVAQAVRL